MTETPARPVRRSGNALDEAVRQAVRDELAERGYVGVTFEGVAKRARTSKPVIYRRYPSRAHMVVDAWVKHTPADLPTGTTGSLRDDLLAVGRAFIARFEHIGIGTLRGLMAEVDDELLQELSTITWLSALEVLSGVFESARERGEIGPEPLPQRVVLLPVVLARHELLFTGTVEEEVLVDIVDTVCLPLMTQDSQPRP